MSECNSGCEECKSRESCGIRKAPLNKESSIHKIIGIISGKGGVGKSTVTALIARRLASMGYSVGIMDADVTGPSVPAMFGIHGKVLSDENGIYPMVSQEDIKIISMNLLLDSEETPVIYRGPVVASIIKQFYSDVIWGSLDYLLIDMPPGTGDVPLTVYQSIPIDGVVMVTSPQNLVKMIVMKAVNMASKMSVPLLKTIVILSVKTVAEYMKYSEKAKLQSSLRSLTPRLLQGFPLSLKWHSAKIKEFRSHRILIWTFQIYYKEDI